MIDEWDDHGAYDSARDKAQEQGVTVAEYLAGDDDQDPYRGAGYADAQDEAKPKKAAKKSAAKQKVAA